MYPGGKKGVLNKCGWCNDRELLSGALMNHMLRRHCMSYLERFIHRRLEVAAAAAEKKLLHELQPSFNLPAKQEQTEDKDLNTQTKSIGIDL